MKKTAYKHSSKIADWQMRDEFEWRDLVGSWRFFWGVFYFLGLGNDCTFLEEVVYNNWYFDYILYYIYIWPSTIILHRHWQWNKNTREQWVHAPPSKTVKHTTHKIQFDDTIYLHKTLCIFCHHNEPFHQTCAACATSPHFALHAIVVLSCRFNIHIKVILPLSRLLKPVGKG